MLLLPSDRDKKCAGYAEQVLTDISAAFGHTFSLLREKIGDASRQACGEKLTDETVLACQQCQAVFVCSADCDGIQELYDALDLPLRIRSLSVPEAACGRHEQPVSLAVGNVLSLDEETMRRAAKAAFFYAREEDILLCGVSPSGASKAEWDAVMRAQETISSQVSSVSLSAPEAVKSMILSADRAGLLLCPPYAGSILLAAGTALCSHPELTHDLSFDDHAGVYAPCPLPDRNEASPFAAALAVAKLLRYSLRLQREAACVEAAVKNVLAAGWHPAQSEEDDGQTAPSVLTLICEQISVAGELMNHGGLKNNE